MWYLACCFSTIPTVHEEKGRDSQSLSWKCLYSIITLRPLKTWTQKMRQIREDQCAKSLKSWSWHIRRWTFLCSVPASSYLYFFMLLLLWQMNQNFLFYREGGKKREEKKKDKEIYIYILFILDHSFLFNSDFTLNPSWCFHYLSS